MNKRFTFRSLWTGLSILALSLSLLQLPVAAINTASVKVGMPFAGQWAYNARVDGPSYNDETSSHPSVHAIYSGSDWATDVYAGAGTEVKLRLNDASGALSFTSNTSQSPSCGKIVRVNISLDGSAVGWVEFVHLDNAITNGTTIVNGMVLGKVTSQGCIETPHTHIEVKNTASNFACYYDREYAGFPLNEGANIGLIGANNSEAQKACPAELTTPTNVPWNFENLEGDPGSVSTHNSNVGIKPDAINFNGTLHAFYYDQGGGNLRVAWSGPNGWTFDNLDGTGGINGRLNADVGYDPEPLIFNNQLHVFYHNKTSGDVRHAWHDGTAWRFETLDGAGGINGRTTANVGESLDGVLYNGTIQLFYYDTTYGNLRHGWFASGIWRFENLDGDPGSVAHANANTGFSPKALVYNTTLQLFYHDITNGNLRHGWSDAGGWHFENLDGDPASVGRVNANLGRFSEAIVYQNSLQVFYTDDSNGNLRHGWSGAGGWAFENLDGDTGSVSQTEGITGLMPEATILNNQLQLFYYDSGDGNLRHAWVTTGWNFETLDGSGGNGGSRSTGDVGHDATVVPFNGKLQLFYYDKTNGNLRHAWSQ